MADRPAVTCYECNSRIDAVNFGVREGTIDATEPEWTRKLNKKESWTKLVLRGKLKVFRGRFACNDIGEDILNGSIAQYWILYCAICTRGYVRVWVACNSEVFFFFFYLCEWFDIFSFPKIQIKEISCDIEGIFIFIINNSYLGIFSMTRIQINEIHGIYLEKY